MVNNRKNKIAKNFGTQHNLDGIEYKTLKVIHRSKRTKENCNSCGVQND